MQAGDQVGHRDVQQAGGRNAQRIGQHRLAVRTARSSPPRRRPPRPAPRSGSSKWRARGDMPLCSSTAKSPTSLGTSCASTARPVITPRWTSIRNAAAISTPSSTLCTVSPMMTMAPELRRVRACRRRGVCVSQSSSWQCRHSTSFSRTKNSAMPPSSDRPTLWYAVGTGQLDGLGQQAQQRRPQQRAGREGHHERQRASACAAPGTSRNRLASSAPATPPSSVNADDPAQGVHGRILAR